MAKNAEAKQKPIQRLFEYAGNFKYLTIASWVLAVISAFAALVPFYFIWCLIKEVWHRIMEQLRIWHFMDGALSEQRCLPC